MKALLRGMLAVCVPTRPLMAVHACLQLCQLATGLTTGMSTQCPLALPHVSRSHICRCHYESHALTRLLVAPHACLQVRQLGVAPTLSCDRPVPSTAPSCGSLLPSSVWPCLTG